MQKDYSLQPGVRSERTRQFFKRDPVRYKLVIDRSATVEPQWFHHPGRSMNLKSTKFALSSRSWNLDSALNVNISCHWLAS